MKVIQIPYCFYPDAAGGTEIYVEALAKSLQAYGVESVVCAPTQKPNEAYFHNDLKVRRFKISDKIEDVSELYGEGDIEAACNFTKILDEEKPDLIHLHALTRAVSLRLVREAKRKNIPTLFTYHTPTVSCLRGTLMFMGRSACNGLVSTRRCAQCALQTRGLPPAAAGLFGYLPLGISEAIGNFKSGGGILTALRMKELAALRHRVLLSFMNEVDGIIALCEWVREVLLLNGLAESKISVVRHGIAPDVPAAAVKTDVSFISGRSLKMVYIGRLNPVKGVEVVIRAIKSAPHLPVEFHIYSVIQDETELSYLRKMRRLAGKDERIVFKNSIPNDKVIPVLKNYDLLVVPSQWFETGPLVVLEAFASGVPVMGSRLGGIAELVTDKVDGVLLEHNSVQEWRQAITGFCEYPDTLSKLKRGIRPVRRSDSVASEISSLYLRAA